MSEQKYFDTIAEGYGTLDTGTTPVRRFSEVYTLLRRLPPVLGRSVLELACSDGFFSRLIKSKGAASLIAVDLSPQMIALARAHEAAEPLGIDYRVGSVFDIGVLGAFDVVFSPFVMSYAKDRQEVSVRPAPSSVPDENRPKWCPPNFWWGPLWPRMASSG